MRVCPIAPTQFPQILEPDLGSCVCNQVSLCLHPPDDRNSLSDSTDAGALCNLTDNPYSPPTNDVAAEPRRSIACVLMFWLTAILGVVVICIAGFNGYQHARFLLENDLGFPPYVIAATILIFACGIGLIYSAWLWRLRRVRAGLLSFIASVVTFFAGPQMLLRLLAS